MLRRDTDVLNRFIIVGLIRVGVVRVDHKISHIKVDYVKWVIVVCKMCLNPFFFFFFVL